MTSMGFTPLGGLVMATRWGSLDPGAVRWMQRHLDGDLDDLLERRSGLVGLCGDADVEVVRRRSVEGDEHATAALDVWRHRPITGIGGCIAALGGLDVLVFTAGIGEHDAAAHAEVAGGLVWAGVRIDDDGTPTDTERELTGRRMSATAGIRHRRSERTADDEHQPHH
jgi:acetate kinase